MRMGSCRCSSARSGARAATTYGIGITGVAGPSGGTAEKPVGLVFLALADAHECKVRKLLLPGDRQLVRTLAVNAALDLLRRKLTAQTQELTDWAVRSNPTK